MCFKQASGTVYLSCASVTNNGAARNTTIKHPDQAKKAEFRRLFAKAMTNIVEYVNDLDTNKKKQILIPQNVLWDQVIGISRNVNCAQNSFTNSSTIHFCRLSLGLCSQEYLWLIVSHVVCAKASVTTEC